MRLFLVCEPFLFLFLYSFSFVNEAFASVAFLAGDGWGYLIKFSHPTAKNVYFFSSPRYALLIQLWPRREENQQQCFNICRFSTPAVGRLKWREIQRAVCNSTTGAETRGGRTRDARTLVAEASGGVLRNAQGDGVGGGRLNVFICCRLRGAQAAGIVLVMAVMKV